MRSERRHHYFRLKNKRKDYWSGINSPKFSGMKVSTPKTHSSCRCCGNPRKMEKEVTRQEQKSEVDFNESKCEEY